MEFGSWHIEAFWFPNLEACYYFVFVFLCLLLFVFVVHSFLLLCYFFDLLKSLAQLLFKLFFPILDTELIHFQFSCLHIRTPLLSLYRLMIWDAIISSFTLNILNITYDFYLVHPLYQFSSVQFSRSVVSDSSQPHGLQHSRLPCPSSTPGAYSNSCPSSWWYHPTISSSVVPFFSRLQSFPASGSFPISQFFPSGGHSIGISASSVLPMNIQDWFPLGWPGWISLQSKGLSRVFSNTTVQKHQFFSAQLSS